jgi:putative peptidoglycan lipid II flippase
VVARVAGFARWGVFSPTVGSTALGDAYTAANTIPNVLFEVVAGGGLAVALVPLLAGSLASGRREQAARTASGLATWTLAVLVPLAVAVAVCADPIVSLLMSGPGDAATRHVAARLLVTFAPQIPLYGIGLVLAGTLQADRRFFWPACAPLLSSLTVIGVYGVFGQLTGSGHGDPAAVSEGAIAWLGWGTTAGVAVLTVPLIIPVIRGGLPLRPTFRVDPGIARRSLGLAGAGMGALIAQQVSVVAVMWLALARGGIGALPTYSYTQAIYVLPYAVLVIPLVTAAFPHVAAYADQSDDAALRATAAATGRAVGALAVLGAAVLIAAAPAVERVFSSIDLSGRVVGLAEALTWFAPGLVGFALVAHATRILYTVRRARVAVGWSAAGWLGVAVAGTVAVFAWTSHGPDSVGVLRGLGAGSSIGMTMAATGLVLALRRAVGAGAVAGLGRTLTGGVVAATLGAIAGRAAAAAVAVRLGGPRRVPSVGADGLLSGDGLAGVDAWAALAGGAVGAVVAAVIVGGAAVAADKSILRTLRRL